jgi:hypothetical protein
MDCSGNPIGEPGFSGLFKTQILFSVFNGKLLSKCTWVAFVLILVFSIHFLTVDIKC